MHTYQANAACLEPVGYESEIQLVSSGQNNGVRVVGKVTGRRFAGSVDDHCGLYAAFEVPARDHVVSDRVLQGAALSRDRVVELPSRTRMLTGVGFVKRLVLQRLQLCLHGRLPTC